MQSESLSEIIKIKWENCTNHRTSLHFVGWSFSLLASESSIYNDKYVVTGNLSARRVSDNSSFPISIDWIPENYVNNSNKKLVKNLSLPILMNNKYNIRFNAKAVDSERDVWRTSVDSIVFKFISNDRKYSFEQTIPLLNQSRYRSPKETSILDLFHDISPENSQRFFSGIDLTLNSSSSNQISVPQVQAQTQAQVIDNNIDDNTTELAIDDDATELAPEIPDVVIDKKRKRDELILQKDMMDSDIQQLQWLLEDNRKKLVKVQESLNKRLSKFSEIDKHLQKMIEKQSNLMKTLENI